MGKYELRSTKRQTKSDADGQEVHLKKSKADNSTESLTEILDLNDDCFDAIFGYLSYDDVLAASQVCLRFEDRARDVFKRKKHNFEVFSVKANGSNKLLRHIGPALLKLELFFGEDLIKNQQTIDIATKYCTENLTEITLHCLTKRNKLRKSFSQVKKLTLSFCDLVGRFKLIKWFPNLASLTYHYTKNLKKFMKQNIPTMHTLNINYVTTHTETITMLISNPQIENLSLHFVTHGGLAMKHSLLTAIDKALPELQTLNLSIDRVGNFEMEYLPLHFKHLKALKIENYADYLNTILINHLAISHTNLERLQLRLSDTAGDPHSYSCVTKYKHLRLLQVMPVRHSLDVEVILMLIHQLPLLEKIEQTADFVNITPWTADEVAKFLRNSNQLMELTYIFDHEAQLKFNRTLNFIQIQFIRSEWMVKTEERLAPKVFDTHGIDGILQKQLVISIAKNPLM